MSQTTTKKEMFVPAEFKVDSGERIIEGYASVFDVRDFGGDVVQSGAYTKSLQERFPKGRIKVLRDHRGAIGVPLEMHEDGRGLFTRSRISRTPLGDETLTLAEDKVLDGMSVGINIMQQKFGDFDGKSTRFITEAMLHEFSIVAFPMNDEARVSTVKSLEEAVQVMGRLPEVIGFVKEDGDLTADELRMAERAAKEMDVLLTEIDRRAEQFEIAEFIFPASRFDTKEAVESWLEMYGEQFLEIVKSPDGWTARRFPMAVFSRAHRADYQSDNEREQTEPVEVMAGIMDRPHTPTEEKSLEQLIDLSYRLPEALAQTLHPETLQAEARLVLTAALDEYRTAASTLEALLEPSDATQDEPTNDTPTPEPMMGLPLSSVEELIGMMQDFTRSNASTKQDNKEKVQ